MFESEKMKKEFEKDQVNLQNLSEEEANKHQEKYGEKMNNIINYVMDTLWYVNKIDIEDTIYNVVKSILRDDTIEVEIKKKYA